VRERDREKYVTKINEILYFVIHKISMFYICMKSFLFVYFKCITEVLFRINNVYNKIIMNVLLYGRIDFNICCTQ